jgi:glyoxylase-like metal-dependent hydrolase (beta-lactamase superfamily II)
MTMPQVTHVFAAPESAFLVNSFIIEGAHSLVVIDAQFLNSSARALRARISDLGKPLAALILTHPHPDHYNGAAEVLAGFDAAPVLATAATDAGIRDTAEAKRAFWTPTYGEDYPQAFVFPSRIVGDHETVRIDDIELTFDDLGPGEASDIVLISAPSTGELFASDLIYAGCHPWLAEERSRSWLNQLAAVATGYADVATVHAGHGPSGDLTLIGRQRDYIERFRSLVSDHVKPGALTPAARAAIGAATRAAHPGFPLEFLIDFNIDGVLAELAAG